MFNTSLGPDRSLSTTPPQHPCSCSHNLKISSFFSLQTAHLFRACLSIAHPWHTFYYFQTTFAWFFHQYFPFLLPSSLSCHHLLPLQFLFTYFSHQIVVSAYFVLETVLHAGGVTGAVTHSLFCRWSQSGSFVFYLYLNLENIKHGHSHLLHGFAIHFQFFFLV